MSDEDQDEKSEPTDVPVKKARKKLVIALALIISLVAGGGFVISQFLLKPQHSKTSPAKDAISPIKNGHPAPEPIKAAEHAPPLAEPEPQQAAHATTPAVDAPKQPAIAPVTETPTPVGTDIQAQLEVLKKQNQEMQAQIEALKKQSGAGVPARSAASTHPREGVLIINGKGPEKSKDTGKK